MHGPNIVFILGSTRSGTSAIRNAVFQTRYKGNGEGHFIGLVHALISAVGEYYASHQAALKAQGTLFSRVSEDHVREQIFAVGRSVYTSLWPTDFVLDKTPTYEALQAVEILEAMWPRVRFIHCSRRGIDNVLSKQRKWPESKFQSLCQEWRRMILEWEARKARLTRPFLDLDFHDIEHDPGAVSLKIGTLLELPADEVKVIHAYLLQNRPEQTAELKRWTPLSDTPWSEGERKIFVSICSEAMTARGYGLETYWS